MTTEPKKWGLGLVANPYATVCLVEIDENGQPVWRQIRAWTGKWDANSNPIYRGTRKVVTTYDVHQPGGMYDAGSVQMIDNIPRDFEEACEIADKCEPGNHVSPTLTVDAAKQLVNDIASGSHSWARWVAKRYTKNWSDRAFLDRCSDEDLANALSGKTEEDIYTRMMALRSAV